MSADRPAPAAAPLLLALTFSTGVIDAVGYLGLDRVFAGNMTGNVVILGMGLVEATDLPVAGPLLALAAFFVGAAAGGRVLRATATGWTARTTVLLAAVTVVLTAAALTTFVTHTHGTAGDARTSGSDTPGIVLAITAVLSLAMGAQAAAARHVRVPDLTTVVVTSTITGLAADSWAAGRVPQPWMRRLGAVCLILLGALAGALALRVDLALGIGLSALTTAVVTALGHRSGASPRSS